MATKEEILDAIAGMSVLELSELLHVAVSMTKLSLGILADLVREAGRSDEERDCRERRDDDGYDRGNDRAGHAPSGGDYSCSIAEMSKARGQKRSAS